MSSNDAVDELFDKADPCTMDRALAQFSTVEELEEALLKLRVSEAKLDVYLTWYRRIKHRGTP